MSAMGATTEAAASTGAHASPLGVTGFALVTGGGSGIGRATCLLLAREGCAGICIGDISAKSAAAVAEELRQAATHPGFRAVTCAVDVVEDASVDGMVAAAVAAFGRVDYAVNCAGIGAVKHGLAETERHEWERMIGVNLTGVFACVKAEIIQMMKQEPLQAG
jgi:NAD(P)-dependent dehydrogenase (short-subunit alcohol dehydrogenase family)